jgi:hypothetical protein
MLFGHVCPAMNMLGSVGVSWRVAASAAWCARVVATERAAHLRMYDGLEYGVQVLCAATGGDAWRPLMCSARGSTWRGLDGSVGLFVPKIAALWPEALNNV